MHPFYVRDMTADELRKAGIIWRLYGFECEEEVGCGSTDTQKISENPYSGDAGDETNGNCD